MKSNVIQFPLTARSGGTRRKSGKANSTTESVYKTPFISMCEHQGYTFKFVEKAEHSVICSMFIETKEIIVYGNYCNTELADAILRIIKAGINAKGCIIHVGKRTENVTNYEAAVFNIICSLSGYAEYLEEIIPEEAIFKPQKRTKKLAASQSSPAISH